MESYSFLFSKNYSTEFPVRAELFNLTLEILVFLLKLKIVLKRFYTKELPTRLLILVVVDVNLALPHSQKNQICGTIIKEECIALLLKLAGLV